VVDREERKPVNGDNAARELSDAEKREKNYCKTRASERHKKLHDPKHVAVDEHLLCVCGMALEGFARPWPTAQENHSLILPRRRHLESRREPKNRES
jgi:hypothetical protein